MIAELAFLQVGLPLLLILMHGILPTAGKSGFTLRTTAIALLLLYLTRAGLWLFPPWWTPYFLGLLLAGATAFRIGRGIGAAPPRSIYRSAEIVIAMIVAGLAVYSVTQTFRTSPSPPLVDLAFPLGPGHYLVLSGGTQKAINAHLMTLTGNRFADYRGQSYGVDLIAVDSFGLRTTGGILPEDPTRYLAYGLPVLAPCAGAVVATTDGIPDMPVPMTDRAHMAGNHIILDCGAALVVIGHLIAGSLRVAKGDRVDAGGVIGLIGNSGNTTEPHLHIHAQTAGIASAPLSGDPIPVSFDGIKPRRNMIFRVPQE